MKKRRLACILAGILPVSAAAADFGPMPPPGAETTLVAPGPPVARLEVVDPRLADSRVTSGIHAGGESPVDAVLAEDVANRLAQDTRLDGATITVVAEDGAVSITGSAMEGGQGEIAQALARQVPGVEAVSGTLHDEGS